MKLFIILALLSCSQIALAQTTTEDSLFPEFSNLSSNLHKELDNQQKNAVLIPKEEESPLEEDLDDETDEELEEDDDDLFEEKPKEISSQQEKLEDTSSETTKEEENSEEEDDSEEYGSKDKVDPYIYLAIDDVKATITPNRNTSFCSAAFAVLNKLKKDLKSISGTFTIGTMTKKFKFDNVKKDQPAAAKYMFVGTSCEQILNEPKLDIKTCEVEGWSEKKCKSKVKFVPIPKENELSLE